MGGGGAGGGTGGRGASSSSESESAKAVVCDNDRCKQTLEYLCRKMPSKTQTTKLRAQGLVIRATPVKGYVEEWVLPGATANTEIMNMVAFE